MDLDMIQITVQVVKFVSAHGRRNNSVGIDKKLKCISSIEIAKNIEEITHESLQTILCYLSLVM